MIDDRYVTISGEMLADATVVRDAIEDLAAGNVTYSPWRPTLRDRLAAA